MDTASGMEWSSERTIEVLKNHKITSPINDVISHYSSKILRHSFLFNNLTLITFIL
jgi:hypothetical protein